MRLLTACLLLHLSSSCSSAPSPANSAPAAILAAPEKALAGAEIELNAESSFDSDGVIADYRFIFGDGTPLAAGNRPRARHVFRAPGVYEVVLLVRDEEGAEGRASRLVTVAALAEEDDTCSRPCGTTVFVCSETEICANGCCAARRSPP